MLENQSGPASRLGHLSTVTLPQQLLDGRVQGGAERYHCLQQDGRQQTILVGNHDLFDLAHPHAPHQIDKPLALMVEATAHLLKPQVYRSPPANTELLPCLSPAVKVVFCPRRRRGSS